MKYSQRQLYVSHWSEKGHSPGDVAAAVKVSLANLTPVGNSLAKYSQAKTSTSLQSKLLCSNALPWLTNLQFFINYLDL